jgi:hypothetical protein
MKESHIKRQKRYHSWKKKYKQKKLFSYSYELAFPDEDAWERWLWLETSPKWFRKVLNKKYRANTKQILRRNNQFVDYDDHREYKRCVKNAAWLWW